MKHNKSLQRTAGGRFRLMGLLSGPPPLSSVVRRHSLPACSFVFTVATERDAVFPVPRYLIELLHFMRANCGRAAAICSGTAFRFFFRQSLVIGNYHQLILDGYTPET